MHRDYCYTLLVLRVTFSGPRVLPFSRGNVSAGRPSTPAARCRRNPVRASQREPRLAVLNAEILPAEEQRESLNAIALQIASGGKTQLAYVRIDLVDALPLGFVGEPVHLHLVRELLHGILDGLRAPVDDVVSLAAETGKVRRDGRDIYLIISDKG